MDGLWWSRIYRWNVCLHVYSTTTAFRAFCVNAFMLKNHRQKICELEWERLSMSSISLRTVLSQLMVERTWLPLSKRIELLVIAMPSIPLSVIWERVNGRRTKSNTDWRGKKRNALQGILTKWKQSTRKFDKGKRRKEFKGWIDEMGDVNLDFDKNIPMPETVSPTRWECMAIQMRWLVRYGHLLHRYVLSNAEIGSQFPNLIITLHTLEEIACLACLLTWTCIKTASTTR